MRTVSESPPVECRAHKWDSLVWLTNITLLAPAGLSAFLAIVPNHAFRQAVAAVPTVATQSLLQVRHVALTSCSTYVM